MIGTEFTLTPVGFLVLETESELERDRSADLRMLPTFRTLLALAPERLGVAVTQLVRQIERLPPPIGILSLARGGIAIGTLLTRVLSGLRLPVEHGTLGWIRGESGPLDDAGLTDGTGSLVVVDGWTGSGDSMTEICERWAGGPMLTAALSDPAGVCDLAGTRQDVLCPHALLQSALSGGLGRVRRLGDGRLVAARDHRHSGDLQDEYHRALLRLSRPLTARSTPNRSPRTRADRDEIRLGINECWRAVARNELAELVVNPRFADEHDVALLRDHHAGPVREHELGVLSCAGLVRAADICHR